MRIPKVTGGTLPRRSSEQRCGGTLAAGSWLCAQSSRRVGSSAKSQQQSVSPPPLLGDWLLFFLAPTLLSRAATRDGFYFVFTFSRATAIPKASLSRLSPA